MLCLFCVGSSLFLSLENKFSRLPVGVLVVEDGQENIRHERLKGEASKREKKG